MPDLPEIDPSLDAPLPEVPPDSQYVPYRTSSTSPDGQVHTVVGYGARARPPIQPPDGFGGGVGMPSLDQTYQAAFSKLPVDDAIKAVEAATRYQGLRGYQRDLQNGSNAAQAFAKWGPMLFRTAVGIPEAIDRSIPTPITPQQLIANRLNQAKFDAAQKAAADKANESKVISAGGGLYRVPPTGPAEALVPPKPPVDTDLKDMERQLRTAQSALDIAKRNVTKFNATKTVNTTGIPIIGPYVGAGPKSTQAPIYKKEDIDKAKASLEAAQTALDEKKDALDKYKSSQSKAVKASAITHTYDPVSKKYQAVDTSTDEE